MNDHFYSRPTPSRRIITRTRLLAAAVSACFAGGAFALPTGPAVVSGSASIAQNGNALNIANSNGAILNWQKFGIAANEIVRFNQASASSSVLNRVVGADPSQIHGQLLSNGRVWLINPAGVMIGPGGMINTAGFVASTLNVSNQDFLAGRLNFQATPGAGNVVNQGGIVTPSGGTVYLVGATVTNEGVINTPNGETILAAGQTVNLIDTATPGVKVEITGAEGNVTNLGEIAATAGRIGMAGVAVRNSGVLNASSVVSDGGRIFLKAAKETYVDGAGRIVATGNKGGSVEVLGDRVAVMDHASIDASGANGGGTVLAGGDYQGRNADVQNATLGYFGRDANIKADAILQGDGGKVIVWANDTTRAYGHISARGGENSGNGGFVETSGKRYLDTLGARVDTSAPSGNTGNWLLDPTDITIYANSGTSTTLTYGGMTDPWGGTATGFYGSSVSAAVYAADINSNLTTTNVMITTQSYGGGYGDITMSSGVNIQNSSGSARSFSMFADRNITVAYGATITGANGSPLSVNFRAYGGATVSGVITTFGGDIQIQTGTGVTVGDLTATYSGAGLLDAGVSPTGSHIRIDAGNGTFHLAYGGKLMADSATYMLQTNPNGYGGTIPMGTVAIGIRAADVQIDANSAGIVSGATYGGDIGFQSSNSSITTYLGTYGGSGFRLDQGEIDKISNPAADAAPCTTIKEACRIWVGNLYPTTTSGGLTTDVSGNVLLPTSGNIVLGDVNFGNHRVHLSTQGQINSYGGTALDLTAAHASLTAYGGVGVTGALKTKLESLSAHTTGGNIDVANQTTYSGANFTLRQIGAIGNVSISTVTGGMQILPFYSDQSIKVTGNLSLTSAGNLMIAANGASYTVGTSTETAPTTGKIFVGGNVELHSGSANAITAYGDHAAGGNFSLYGGSAGITLTDAGIAVYGGALTMTTTGDLTIQGVSSGSIVTANGGVTLAANNIYLTGGNAVNPYGSTRFAGTSAQQSTSYYGSGVLVSSGGHMSVTASNHLDLQAGSANSIYGGSTYGGSSYYGASVALLSSGTQDVQARVINLSAGATGHDNTAVIYAYGNQNITAAYGGAGGIAIYGGGASGSYSNAAGIRHGDWNSTSAYGGVGTAYGSGNLTVTLAYGGGSIAVYGGAGTGSGGWQDTDCYPTACATSNNGAFIDSNIGDMTVSYTAGSGNTMALTGGGGAGDYGYNEAGIHSRGGLTIGSATARPDITITGGSAGGQFAVDSLGKPKSIDNSANISVEKSGTGDLLIYGGTVTLSGGSAVYGGAFIGGSNNVTINTSGNLHLAGGSGGNSAYEWVADSAGIGNDSGTAVINLNVGGSLTLEGGSAYGSMAMIGSLTSVATVNINATSGISAVGNAGGVGIGRMDAATGTTVMLNGGSGNVSFDATSSLRADSLTVSGQGISLLGNNNLPSVINLTSYGANANGDITLNLGSGSLGSVNANTDLGTSQTVSFYGGAFNLSVAADMAGDSLGLYASSGGITFSGGSIGNAKNVTLSATNGGIYNSSPAVTVIDTSGYGGAISLTGTEIGLPPGNLTQLGTPITINPGTPGTGTVSATATSGGINLYQTVGTLATGKYTLASPAGNHVHLRSANALNVDGAVNLPDNRLLLIAEGGAINQTAPITAATLFASAYGGIALTDTGNRVSTFGAYNSGSGDIAYKNAEALFVSDHYEIGYGVKNDAGAIDVATLAGNLSIHSDIAATSAITLRAAGNLVQQYGTIANDATTGSNDIAVYGADIELRNVRSQRDVAITATGALTLRSFSGTDYIDDQYFTYNLPFSFSFYGVAYSQAYISSNGLIAFGEGTASYSDSLSGLGSYKAIAPAWNDWELLIASGKDIFITRPTASSLAVTWDVNRYPRTGINAKFGAVLSDSGAIRFDYGPAQGSFAGDVTIGLSNGSSASTLASQLMNEAAFSLSNLKSTTFTPDGSGGYIETLSATSTPLPSTSGAFSGGNVMMGVSYSAASAVTAARNLSLAAGGVINAYSGITAAAVNAVSNGGATFSGDNQISAFSASNSGSGDIVLANGGALALGSVSNNGGNVSIANWGALTETGGITTNRLLISSSGGAVLSGANRVANFYATNSGSGDIALTNTSDPLTISGITNTGYAGNISVDNIGGITIDGGIQAYQGGVTLTAHSPININSSVTAGGGSIALSATTGITLSSSASLAASDSVSAATSSGDIVVPTGASVSVGTGKSMAFSAPGGSVSLDGNLSGATPTKIDSSSSPNSSSGVTDQVTQTLTEVTNTADTSDVQQTNDIPPVLPPSSGGTVATPTTGTQTIGGDIGQFGGGDTVASNGASPFSGGTTDTSSSSTAVSSNGTSPSSSEPANSATSSDDNSKSASGDKDNGKDSKDGKQKKDDKKSTSSGEKKDDKSSGKKSVGKCSA